MNYDLHHIVKSLQSANSRQKLKSYHPMMRSLLHSISAFLSKRGNASGKRDELTVYENLCFIDSFKFTPCSLDKLVQSFSDNKFSLLDHFYQGYTDEQQKLLKKNGNFPYSHVDSFSKLNELSLPCLKNWKNSLKDNQIDVTNEVLIQLNNVFKVFNCENLKQFLQLCLKGVVLQSACWFEELRSVCYNTYGLDCSQFYTASNLSGSACLKVCEPEAELLTDRQLLDLTERMMRGGFFSSRHEVANNTRLPEIDESKDVSSIIYIDANNLYGGVVLQYPLPLKDFELVEGTSLDTILPTEDERYIGFLVEVDLEYPDELHDKHADYPLVPDKESIDPLELSDFQTSLKNTLKLTVSKTKKNWDRPSIPRRTMWFTIVTWNSTLTTASKLHSFIKL